MISRRRRYWNELVSFDGGLSLLMMDGLLAVPLIMAAFFYPLQVRGRRGPGCCQSCRIRGLRDLAEAASYPSLNAS
jgi:hypothetical protein